MAKQFKEGNVVTVPVKSAKKSKIVWTSVVGWAVTIATMVFGPDFVPPDLMKYLLAGEFTLASALTVIWKVFFTTTVTPQSAPAAEEESFAMRGIHPGVQNHGPTK